MTAISLSSIPSAINTAERLLVYAAMLVENISNDAVKVNVQQGQPAQPVCGVSVQTTADGVKRFVIASYIPIDPVVFAGTTAKRWMAANDISLASAHTVFSSN